MIGSQSLKRAGILYPKLPRGAGFLLGAVAAALVVVTITGAGLMLSGGVAGVRGAASGDSGHYRLPPPQLSLGTVPLKRPDGALG